MESKHNISENVTLDFFEIKTENISIDDVESLVSQTPLDSDLSETSCPEMPPDLVGPLKIEFNVSGPLEVSSTGLLPGGEYFPDCKTRSVIRGVYPTCKTKSVIRGVYPTCKTRPVI